MDRPRQVAVEPAHHPELVGQFARIGPAHVAPHDARPLVLQFRALLEHVVEHAPEAPPGNDLLDHAPPLLRVVLRVVADRPSEVEAQPAHFLA